jgi:hypothetical protein
MRTAEILCFVHAALEEVFAQDSVLFDLGANGISEQSVTFRLGHYLQHRFPHSHVDCEYNRCGTDPKTDEQVDLEWMKPDVIVHERKEKHSNLVVIEAKKAALWNAGWHDIDQKLRAFTRTPGKYEYRLGLAWRIATSRDPAHHSLVWFWCGGKLCGTPVLGFQDEILARISTWEEAHRAG